MSPVHVIVGQDERAEAMWATAFSGAVDLYRFERNVDAFERLTVAEAPVDLVVLTPAQHGPFNLTADQFLARVLEGPLGSSRCLANLHVIVVGEPVSRTHPRVMAVSTLDAAIRLVKFGELERAPRPHAPVLPVATPNERPRASVDDIAAIIGDSAFSDSVISRIWDAPAEPEARPEPRREAPRRDDVVGGGPRRSAARAAVEAVASGPVPATGLAGPGEAHMAAPAPAPAAAPQLFSRAAAPGFVVAPAPVPVAPAPAAPVVGGGAPAPVGAPGEAIQVATGALQASRPYQLPNGAGYRGPALREGQVHGALHTGGSPVPPALASQVQSMVYGHGGAVPDPLLVWSSSSRGQIVPQGVPVPGAPMAPAAAPVPVPVPVAPAPSAPAVRTVPTEPPAGAYGGAAPQPASADPFLARAEQGGGAVSFG